MLILSHDQKKALKDVLVWYKKDRGAMQYITLGGYAGTGKTTFIAILRRRLHRIEKKLKVGFASFTGKAARVLRNKLRESNAITDNDTVGTIHSLIYSPIVDDKEQIIGWKTKDKIDRDLIIIDEASMVDEIIWQHLLAYKVPIIVVGDHGQLPPIRGNFNLIHKPYLKLEEIHRQAKNNPIIVLSLLAREKGMIPPGDYGDKIKKIILNTVDAQETVSDLLGTYNEETLVLCGYNKTRRKLNSFIRGALGFESPFPQSGDRVICLRNNHKDNIFNGMLGIIVHIENAGTDWYRAEIKMDEEEKHFNGLISVKQFNSDTSLNFTDKRSERL